MVTNCASIDITHSTNLAEKLHWYEWK